MTIEENVQIVKDFFAAIGSYNEHDLLALVTAIWCFGKALPLFDGLADFTNRFVSYRCRWVRAWGSRPSRRPAPVPACRYTPGSSSLSHLER